MEKSENSIYIITASTFCVTIIGYIAFRILGQIFFEFDSVLHFTGGMFGGSFGMAVLLFLSPQYISARNLILCSIISAFIMGSLWEGGQEFILHLNYPLNDTILDLMMDIFGGWLVAFIYIKRQNNKE